MGILQESKFWVEIFFLLNGTILMLLGISKTPMDYLLFWIGFSFMLVALLLEMEVYSYWKR